MFISTIMKFNHKLIAIDGKSQVSNISAISGKS